jgi:RNA polymerase sigma factor (sigma-70 family)
MAENDNLEASNAGADADRSKAEYEESVARLFLRRSKLTPKEAALFRRVFPSIVAKHHKQVWDALRRRCVEGRDMDDLKQEIFLTLHAYILEHGFPESIGGKLHDITRGKLSNYRRIMERSMFSIGEPSSASMPPKSGPNVDSALHTRELVRRAFEQLSPELQQVLELVFMERLTHGDAAEVLGLPLGTLKSRALIARREFLVQLNRFRTPSQRAVV